MMLIPVVSGDRLDWLVTKNKLKAVFIISSLFQVLIEQMQNIREVELCDLYESINQSIVNYTLSKSILVTHYLQLNYWEATWLCNWCFTHCWYM